MNTRLSAWHELAAVISPGGRVEHCSIDATIVAALMGESVAVLCANNHFAKLNYQGFLGAIDERLIKGRGVDNWQCALRSGAFVLFVDASADNPSRFRGWTARIHRWDKPRHG